MNSNKRGWDKSPSLSIIFGLSSKTQWLSGLYYADFIIFYSPTQLCGGGTTKSNSNESPTSVPLYTIALKAPSPLRDFLVLFELSYWILLFLSSIVHALHRTLWLSRLCLVIPSTCS